MVTGHFVILNFDFGRMLHSQLLTPKISTGRQCVLLCWRDGIKYQPRELSDPSLPSLTAIVCKLTQPVLFSLLTPHHACRALPHRSSSPSFLAARTAPNSSVFHASSCLLLQEPQVTHLATMHLVQMLGERLSCALPWMSSGTQTR